MNKTITIYTTTTCAYCEMVKKWLGAKGLPFTTVNLDEQTPEVRQKVIDMSGAMTTPVTVVQDAGDEGKKDIIVGWNPAKLAAAIQGMM